MSNGKSRSKGLRGEKVIVKKLGGKRVGVAFAETPVDVDLGWAVVQVKNKSLGGAAIDDALSAMERVTPKEINKYVMFKPRRGRWLVVESLEQHEADHGRCRKEDKFKL